MVELFATHFHGMPRFVETPVPRVATRQLPTLATLHRPFRESGPVDGIFTRFVYDGLQQTLKVCLSRPRSKMHGIECQDYSFISVLLRYKCSMHQRKVYSGKPPSNRTNHSHGIRLYGQVA
jgi:hypothetical protein